MNFIKKFSQLKKINIFIMMGLLSTLSCSGPQVITTGATAAIAAAEDEKTLGDAFDDTSISIGIKDRIFMYEAILITKVGVDVERGKVLLTGILNDQSKRVEIVRLAWKQPGVKEVINEIILIKLNTLVVLKSTVLPNHIQEIESIIPNFVYNPEFLREKHADRDFIDSNLIIFGGKSESSKLLANVYENYTKCLCKDYVYTDATSASLMKYTINSFLATKVSFFNEINQLYKISGAKDSWEQFIEAISKDERIGNSHMQVPGHDGRFGFGGACLPKDSSAFSIYADSKNKKLNVLKSAINTNNNIRASYNNSTKREQEHNIQYKGES